MDFAGPCRDRRRVRVQQDPFPAQRGKAKTPRSLPKQSRFTGGCWAPRPCLGTLKVRSAGECCDADVGIGASGLMLGFLLCLCVFFVCWFVLFCLEEDLMFSSSLRFSLEVSYLLFPVSPISERLCAIRLNIEKAKHVQIIFCESVGKSSPFRSSLGCI